MIPFRVDVVAVLISSPALQAHSCVLGSVPTLGFDIARTVNKHQVNYHCVKACVEDLLL